MPSSRIPSPSRSQGARSTPRRYKPRPSRSLCSPARSNNSFKLSAVIRSQMDSFVLSPMPTRRSVLADTTDIDVPRRRSWWRKLDENSREIMEVLNNKEPIEANNAIEEYIEVDVLSQEKKNFTFDLPESSDSESISSIVIPQRKLFTQKENQPQNKFGQIINTRESLAKLHKSQAIDEKGLNVGPKNLFNGGTKPRSKPIFPSALLNISASKTTANKPKDQPINEGKGQIKSLFGNKQSAKRKNMFADFIVSESEDEVPVVVSQKKLEQKRYASLNNHAEREPSPSSNTDIEMALLNISENKTTANKPKDQPINEGKGQIKSLFGNKPNTKRKNMFADFIVSESEDEVPVVVSQKKLEQKRNASLKNHADREPSPSSITDIEMDDWRLLPSSTMVDHQLEEGLRNTPSKRARLEKLSEANNTIANKTKQSNNSLNSKNKSKIRETLTTNEEKPGDDIDTQNTTRQSLRKKDISTKNASHERSARKETNKTKDNNNASQVQTLMESLSSINVAVKNGSKYIEAKEKLNQTKTRSRIDQVLQSEDDEDDFTLEYDNDDDSVKEIEENKTVRENKSQNSQHSSKIDKVNNQQSNISKGSQKSSKEQKNQADKNEQVKNYNEKLVEDKEKDDAENDQMKENFVKSQNDCQEIENDDRTDKEYKDGQEDQESDLEKRGPDQEEQQHYQQEQENDFEEKDGNRPDKEQLEEHLRISPSKKVRESNNTTANKTSHLNESLNLKNKSKTRNVVEEQETDQVEDDIEKKHENNVNEQETDQEEEDDLQVQEHDDDGNKSDDDIEEEANASYQGVEDVENLQDDSEVEDNVQECNNTSQNIGKKDESEEEIEQDHDESDTENVEQDNDSDQDENRDVADGEMQDSAQNMSQDMEEGDEEVENELEVEDDEKEDAENTNESEKNDSQDVENAEEIQTSHENEEDETEPDDVEEIENNDTDTNDEQNEEDETEPDDVEEIENNDTDTNDEQNDSQDYVENEIVNNDSDGDENNENQSIEHNEEQISGENTEANLTHDTTGRHRKKYDSKVRSPEAILHQKTRDMESFVKGRNTSVRKTKSMIKNLNIRPSLAPVRESIGLTDGSNDMSAEGSGWDSHRTTRVTLRKTFGKDFTPRKSLRTLVMEKSAKRQTVANLETNAEISTHPRANSTELPEPLNMHDDDGDYADDGQDMQESDHEASRRMRQTTLETYLQKIKQQNAERSKQLDEKIRSSLQNNAPRLDVFNSFKVPAVPKRRIQPLQSKPKAKPVKSVIPLDMLPPELLEDMKYKPPKRYRPANASWITKRLYKFLETKLEPKYDYKARIRSEKLVETIYNFTKDIRRQRVAPSEAVNLLKLEMARLDVVKTHFDFYEFFHEFMPREVRIKVNPDVFNNISLPKHGVFSDILR